MRRAILAATIVSMTLMGGQAAFAAGHIVGGAVGAAAAGKHHRVAGAVIGGAVGHHMAKAKKQAAAAKR